MSTALWTDRDGIEPASHYTPPVAGKVAAGDRLTFDTATVEARGPARERPPSATGKVAARGLRGERPALATDEVDATAYVATCSPVDAFLTNANECDRFKAPLAVLRLTPSQVMALLILWAYGRGAELIEYTSKELSKVSVQPPEFFDEHLAAALARLAEMKMPLFQNIQRGLFVASTGFWRPSIVDTSLFRQALHEIEAQHPVNPMARVTIATNVLREAGAVLPEPEPEPDDAAKPKGEAKPRRIPTAPHALNLILRSADDIVTRAEGNPEIDDVALLGHAALAIQALLNTRRQIRQARFERSAAGEITAAESSETVNSSPSPDLHGVIAAAGEITAAEHNEEATRGESLDVEGAGQPPAPERPADAEPTPPCAGPVMDAHVCEVSGCSATSEITVAEHSEEATRGDTPDVEGAGQPQADERPADVEPATAQSAAPSIPPTPSSGSKISCLTQHRAQPSKVTLETFARYACLPEDFLASVGIGMWTDHRGHEYLGIPHFDSDGVLLGMKQRVHLLAPDDPTQRRFCWVEGKAGLYGAECIQEALQRPGGIPALIVCEGITDQLTFKYHGMPAVGLSSAATYRALGAEHLAGIANVVIARDADRAGLSMAMNLSQHLMNEGYQGGIFSMHFDDAKDASAMHKLVEGDRAKFKLAYGRSYYATVLSMREVDYSTGRFRP